MTTRTVSSVIAVSIASGSARKVTGSTGTRSTATPKRCPALCTAAWTVLGATIRGAATSGLPSRAASTARSSDSVPPEVAVPTVVAGPWSRARAIATRSDSIRASEGKAVGSSPFVAPKAASASRPIASASASPES